MRRLLSRSRASGAGEVESFDPDLPLVAGALRDRQAFGALFDRYWDPMFKFCYSHLGDWHAAEDAASETFSKALANLDHFDPNIPGTTFRAWLFGIARHVIGTTHRYASRHPQTAFDALAAAPDPAQSTEEAVLAAERHEQLRLLLDQLPANQRELLELRMAGLSAVEIGRALGRSQDAIRKAQSRSVISLRDAVERQNAVTKENSYG